MRTAGESQDGQPTALNSATEAQLAPAGPSLLPFATSAKPLSWFWRI